MRRGFAIALALLLFTCRVHAGDYAFKIASLIEPAKDGLRTFGHPIDLTNPAKINAVTFAV